MDRLIPSASPQAQASTSRGVGGVPKVVAAGQGAGVESGKAPILSGLSGFGTPQKLLAGMKGLFSSYSPSRGPVEGPARPLWSEFDSLQAISSNSNQPGTAPPRVSQGGGQTNSLEVPKIQDTPLQGVQQGVGKWKKSNSLSSNKRRTSQSEGGKDPQGGPLGGVPQSSFCLSERHNNAVLTPKTILLVGRVECRNPLFWDGKMCR